jgi:hypothetical protein
LNETESKPLNFRALAVQFELFIASPSDSMTMIASARTSHQSLIRNNARAPVYVCLRRLMPLQSAVPALLTGLQFVHGCISLISRNHTILITSKCGLLKAVPAAIRVTACLSHHEMGVRQEGSSKLGSKVRLKQSKGSEPVAVL